MSRLSGSVSSTQLTTAQVAYKNATGKKVVLHSSSSQSADYTLTLPAAAPDDTNRTLSTGTDGVLSWKQLGDIINGGNPDTEDIVIGSIFDNSLGSGTISFVVNNSLAPVVSIDTKSNPNNGLQLHNSCQMTLFNGDNNYIFMKTPSKMYSDYGWIWPSRSGLDRGSLIRSSTDYSTEWKYPSTLATKNTKLETFTQSATDGAVTPYLVVNSDTVVTNAGRPRYIINNVHTGSGVPQAGAYVEFTVSSAMNITAITLYSNAASPASPPFLPRWQSGDTIAVTITSSGGGVGTAVFTGTATAASDSNGDLCDFDFGSSVSLSTSTTYSLIFGTNTLSSLKGTFSSLPFSSANWNTTFYPYLVFKTDGAPVMTVLGDLSVGNNAGNKVTVSSSAAASSYRLTLPANQASASQFLSNDGSGALSWTTLATVLDGKDSVLARTVADLEGGSYSTVAAGSGSTRTLTRGSNGAIASDAAAFDGVTLILGSRVLVMMQSTASDNGIYTVTNAGGAGSKWVLTRAVDANSSAKVTNGLFTLVTSGDIWNATAWLLTTSDTVTLETTALSFVQYSKNPKNTRYNTQTITSTATLTTDYNLIEVDATSANVVLTLPATASSVGINYQVFKTDSSANSVTIKPASGESLDNVTDGTTTLTSQYDRTAVTGISAGWYSM